MIAGIGDLEWREATNKAGGANNPNRLWPVAVRGFDDLLERKKAQVLPAQATIVLQCICDNMTVATNAPALTCSQWQCNVQHVWHQAQMLPAL